MGENYALELRDISKSFGSVQANDHVNLTLRKSEILAILGENGSGKTTLMNMIYGIYYPDEGHIFVNGKEVTIRSPKDSYELGIGMVHQHFKLVDVLTAAENIVLGLPGKGKLDMKKITEDIQKLVDKYGFELDLSQKIYDQTVWLYSLVIKLTHLSLAAATCCGNSADPFFHASSHILCHKKENPSE